MLIQGGIGEVMRSRELSDKVARLGDTRRGGWSLK